MGNGYNHPDNCNCDFCNSRGQRARSNSYFFNLLLTPQLENFQKSFSYTNPNAICRYCGQTIFFYQNSYGSRVFFDHLGKPWPKHECYYVDISHFGFTDKLDRTLTLENIPKPVETNSLPENKSSERIVVHPIIIDRLPDGYKVVSIENSKSGLTEEYILEYPDEEFGICFLVYNEGTFLDGYYYEKYFCECFRCSPK